MAATTQVQILARTFCGIARRFKLHSTFFRFPLRQLLKRVAPHCRLIDAGVRVVYGDGVKPRQSSLCGLPTHSGI